LIRKESLTEIIPARGGSKGVHRKNLLRFGKYSLLERSIKLAQKCDYVERVIVSTDDQEMLDVATRLGVAPTALRPANLATSTASAIDVILQVLEAESVMDGYVVLLQPTSPLRVLDDFVRLCQQFDDGPEAIVSLTEYDSPHPMKTQKIDEEGWVRSYLGVESMVVRQLLPKVHKLNGAFYLTHRRVLV